MKSSVWTLGIAVVASVASTGCLPQAGITGEVTEEIAALDAGAPVEPSPSPSASPSPAPSPTPSPSPSASPTPPPNVNPIANAGSDRTITLPTSSATLSGSGTDADGTIASYQWTKVSGAGTQAIASATSAATSISGFAAAGTYVFRLRVTDNRGGQDTDDVQVTVQPAPSPSPSPSPSPTPSASPNPVPSVSVPVIEGLAPPATLTPCRLQVWKRNVPGTNPSFNNFDAVLFVPCDYYADPDKRYPLVISNHGRGGSTLDTATHSNVGGKNFEGFIKQLADGKALQLTYGAIVIAPDIHAVGDGGDFFPGTAQTDRAARLILDAIKHLKVDPKRVTVTGLSYGGTLTEDLMISYLPLLAGAAPVAMQPPNKGGVTADNTCRYVHFPLWAAGNTGDGVYNYYEWSRNSVGGFKYTLSRCAGYVEGEYFRLTGYNANAHSGWDEFYSSSETQFWLMNQAKP